MIVKFATRQFSKQQSGEQGYVLLLMIFFLTLMMIALTASIPAAKTAIKRDHEEELIHRGNQYARAIGRYYKKFGRYPISIEQLENTNDMRFLRKRYKDPITGKDDWKLIHFGEMLPSTGTSFNATSNQNGGGGPAAGMTPAAGSGGFNSSMGTGSLNQGPNMPISNPTSPMSSAFGSTTQNQNGNQGPTGMASTQNSTGAPGSGQLLGGGPIVGVASPSEEESLKVLNKQTHYNEWQFVYDPTRDASLRGPRMNPGNMPGGQTGPMGGQGLNGPGMNGPGMGGPGMNGPGMGGPGGPGPMPGQTPAPIGPH